MLRDVYPVHEQLFEPDKLHYYWSADETEWATDIAFRSAKTLDRLYPALVRQAINPLGCQDVLRFFGRRSSVQMLKSAELTSHLGVRGEGVRVKHSLERNSQKMYRKQPELIRLENTINNTRQMKVYRASEDNPQGPKSYQRLRKGVADLHRRAKISQKCNERANMMMRFWDFCRKRQGLSYIINSCNRNINSIGCFIYTRTCCAS